MSKKVYNKLSNSEIINADFSNVTSNTVYVSGDFRIDSSFSNHIPRSYSNKVSSRTEPITLESVNLSDLELFNNVNSRLNKVIINYDKSDILKYAKYGSLKERIKATISNLLLTYPASVVSSGFYFNTTTSTQSLINNILEYTYNEDINIAKFKVPTLSLINNFGISINSNDRNSSDKNPYSNLNTSYLKYSIYFPENSETEYNIIGFTGATQTDSYIYFEVIGNPFTLEYSEYGRKNFHIRPNFVEFQKYLFSLDEFEKYVLSNKTTGSTLGYKFIVKVPQILENGLEINKEINLIWPTTDGYNLDYNSSLYGVFYKNFIEIGNYIDDYKSDFIYRHFTPSSLKIFDQTGNGNMEKLLKIYGRSFDEILLLINNLSELYNVDYADNDNISSVLVKNLAKILGWWSPRTISDESSLLDFVFSKQNTKKSLVPSELDTELWKRIVLNTGFLMNSKGTRKAIQAIFEMLGFPDDIIAINEYVYVANEKIDPNNPAATLDELKSKTIPYNEDGYPIAPIETEAFFFQLSGDTDYGQTYIDNFRKVGFSLNRYVDNRKSWTYSSGSAYRTDSGATFYYEPESNLVINTKEIDAGVDIAKGIEAKFFQYNQAYNFPIADTGTTKPYFYINIPVTFSTSSQTSFSIPEPPSGDIQVNLNGINLTKDVDYTVSGQDFTLDSPALYHSGAGIRDVLTVTYGYDRTLSTGFEPFEFVIERITVDTDGQTTFILTDEPQGAVQVSIGGVTLLQETDSVSGDYYIDTINPKKVVIKSLILGITMKTYDVVNFSYIKNTSASISVLNMMVENHIVSSLNDVKTKFDSLTNKTTYFLNNKLQQTDSVKIIYNGLTLQPTVDYELAFPNSNRIILNARVVIGDSIQAFYDKGVYTLSNQTNFTSITNIESSTFGQYINALNIDFINVRNRKILYDQNGGGYPTLTKLWDDYKKRSTLSSSNPLKTVDYRFDKMFNYFNRFGNIFNKFLKEFLPATVIMRKSGFFVRNTIFNQQKFVYKRGFDDGSDFWGSIENKLSGYTVSTNVSDVISSDGKIEVFAIGGIGSLSYSIDNGATFQTNPVFSGLTVGTYSGVKVKDRFNTIGLNGRVSGYTCSLSEDTLTVRDVSTVGGSDGRIKLTVSSPNGGVEYSIDNITYQSSGTFNNLTADNYRVYYRDAVKCSGRTSVIKVEGITCNLSIESVSTTSSTGSNGSITVNTIGGVGAILYNIDGGSYQTSNVFNGLAEGTYVIGVKDSANCTDSANAVVSTAICDLTITNLITTDTSIKVITTGGVGTVRYRINGGAYKTSNKFNGLTSGNYTIDVIDSNDCTDSDSVTLCGLTIDSFATTFDSGSGDATATVNTSNGIGTVQYRINGGAYQTSPVFTGLEAGNYIVDVLDSEGCTDTSNVTIKYSCDSTIVKTTSSLNYHIYPTYEIYSPETGIDIRFIWETANRPNRFTIKRKDGGEIYDGLTSLTTGWVGAAPANGCYYNGPWVTPWTDGSLGFILIPAAYNTTNDYLITVEAGPAYDGSAGIGGCTPTETVGLTDSWTVSVVCEPCTLSIDSFTYISESIFVNASGGFGDIEYRIDGGEWQLANNFNVTNAGDYLIEVRDAQTCTDSATATVVYGCGTTLSGTYADTYFHVYSPKLITLETGTLATFIATAGDRPNKFYLRRVSDGVEVLNSGWIGFASYAGPWGTALYGPSSTSLTLTAVNNTTDKYYLYVEAGNADPSNPVTDSWEVTIGC